MYFSKFFKIFLLSTLLTHNAFASAFDSHSISTAPAFSLDIDTQMAINREIFAPMGGTRAYVDMDELIPGLSSMLTYGQTCARKTIEDLKLDKARQDEYCGIIERLGELTVGDKITVVNYKTAVRQMAFLLEEAYNATPNGDGSYTFKYQKQINSYLTRFAVGQWRDRNALREFTKQRRGIMPQFYVFLSKTELTYRDFVDPFLKDISFPMMPTPLGMNDPDVGVHGAPGKETIIGILLPFLHDENHWGDASHLVPGFPDVDQNGLILEEPTDPTFIISGRKPYLTWLAEIYKTNPVATSHLFALVHEIGGHVFAPEDSSLRENVKANIATEMQSDYIEIVQRTIRDFVGCFLDGYLEPSDHILEEAFQHRFSFYLNSVKRVPMNFVITTSPSTIDESAAGDERLTIRAIEGLEEAAPYFLDDETKISKLEKLEDFVTVGPELTELTLSNICNLPYGLVYLLNDSEEGRKNLFFHDYDKIYEGMTGRHLDPAGSLTELNTQYYGEVLRFVKEHEASLTGW